MREDALRSLAKTYDSPVFSRVVENIIRSLRFGSSLVESLEEAVCNDDGGNDANDIGEEAGSDGMAGVADAHGTEVDSQDVEGGVSGSLEETGETTGERVGAIGLHGIDHHATGTAAAEGFHEGRGQGIHPTGCDAELPHAPAKAGDEGLHGSGGAEDANGHEDGHEVGNDAYGGLKASLGSLDNGFVDVHLPEEAYGDEGADDEE